MASPPEAADSASWSELLRSDYAGALVLLCAGIWLHAGDELMVATVIPAMVGDIGGDAYISWTTALYEVGSITASALGAWFARQIGLKRSLVIAALVYLAGCLISALAPQMPAMLLGRLVQGLGGGAIVAVTLVAAWRMFPGRLLPRAVAAISLVWGVAAFAGPMVGALFVEWGNWRGAFLFFAAQALIYAVAAWARGPSEDTIETGPAPFPIGRMAILAAGVVAVATAGVVARTEIALLCGAAGLGLVALFVVLDARAGDMRLLPAGATRLMSPAGVTIALVFGLSSGAIALLVYGPVLISAIHGLSPLWIGFILVLESVGWSLAALFVAGAPRNAEPGLIIAGAAIVLIGVVGLALTIAFGPIWLVPLFATVQGSGFGLSWTFILRRATALVGPEDGDRVSAAINTVQRFGYALGAAAIGILANKAGLGVGMGAEAARHATLAIFLPTVVPGLIGLAAAIRFARLPEPVSA